MSRAPQRHDGTRQPARQLYLGVSQHVDSSIAKSSIRDVLGIPKPVPNWTRAFLRMPSPTRERTRAPAPPWACGYAIGRRRSRCRRCATSEVHPPATGRAPLRQPCDARSGARCRSRGTARSFAVPQSRSDVCLDRARPDHSALSRSSQAPSGCATRADIDGRILADRASEPCGDRVNHCRDWARGGTAQPACGPP